MSGFHVLDTFTDVDMTDLAAHTPEVGGPWTESVGSWKIISDQAKCTSSTANAKATIDATESDFILRATQTIPAADSSIGGVLFRYVDANNWWGVFVIHDPGDGFANIFVERTIAGVTTARATFHVDMADGETFDLVVDCKGDRITVSLKGSSATVHDTTHETATVVGLYDYTTAGYVASTFSLFSIDGTGGLNMITLKTGRWNAHREGVAEVLKAFGQALCAGTALAMTAEIRLFTSANAPGCDDVAADYDQATFSGYAAKVIDSGDGGCTDLLEFGVNADGIGQIVIDQQAWVEGSPATITETVTGAYLVIIDGASTILLGTFLFDNPVAMAAPGDTLKVAGNLLLDCQMVPVA